MQFEEERPRRYRHRRHRRSSSTSGEKLWMCCEYMCVHDHRVVVVCAPTIVSSRCPISEMLVQVPREALEIAGTSINFRSGKFGYSICPIFSKGHAKFFREIWHDFAKNRTYGTLRLTYVDKLSDVFIIFVVLTYCLFLMQCEHVGQRSQLF